MKDTVVVLAGEGDSGRIVVNHIASVAPVVGFLVERGVSRVQLLRNRARRLGPWTAMGQALFVSSVVPWLRFASRARIAEIKHRYDMDDSPYTGVTQIDSVNSAATIRLLRSLAPSVVLVSGTRLLSKQTLEAVPAPFINWHAGITPHYRGVHGGYWSLVEGNAAECGVTVHLIDVGIDTGGILGQALIHPTSTDNFTTYPYLQLATALPLIKSAVRDASEGRSVVLEKRSTQSKLWSHPTLLQYARHRALRGVR